MAKPSTGTAPIEASLKALSAHFRSLEREHPDDYWGFIKSEISASKLPPSERVFVVKTLNTALREDLVLVEHATDDLICSFCGKGVREIKSLIRGQAAAICPDCIQVCNEMVAEDS